MWSRKFSLTALCTALLALAYAGAAAAQQTVKVGAIYPLSGNAASAGNYSKAAIELAVDIINNDHPELKDLQLAASTGLPRLGARQDGGRLPHTPATPA